MTFFLCGANRSDHWVQQLSGSLHSLIITECGGLREACHSQVWNSNKRRISLGLYNRIIKSWYSSEQNSSAGLQAAMSKMAGGTRRGFKFTTLSGGPVQTGRSTRVAKHFNSLAS